MNPDENTPWEYKPDSSTAGSNLPPAEDSTKQAPQTTSPDLITWEASEFIDHPHGAGWYALLIISTAAMSALVYLASKDKIATGIIAVVGVIVGIFAAQKPKVAKYEINNSGLSVNGKNYNYSGYKSFAVINEGSLSSVNLFPLKRFMPPVSAYFDPKDEQKIAQSLGNYLPYEERKLDSVDRISRRLRL
jgi:hypothetical protein